MSKRILSLVLTLALVLGSFSMAFADTNAIPPTSSLALSDVEGTQYEKAVTTLGKLDILNGFPDGTFRPENTITRAEFAAVAVRVRGLETAAENSKGNTRFPDVDASHWASGYVNVAEKNGLVKGVVTAEGENIFRPEGKITYEQAVTMIVRALGYQYAAEALGGYPVGHLSVASREQLLRNIPVSEGSQGQPASRGFVALLVSNALDIPKMIQVGYGDQAKWIISGTEGTRETYLFEDLGLKQLTKAQVTKADSKTQKVTIGVTPLKADKDFDYAGFEGMRVTAWYNPRTEQLVVAKDDGAYKARYDVVKKVEGKNNQLELVSSKDKINVAEKAKLRLNGEDVTSINSFTEGSNAYAKVIVNEYGEINWVDAYSLEGKIVVKNVEKDTIKGYGREEISNANDYTIIKNGKQISASQLKDKDLVIYNAAEETAVVVTDVREGKLERVYSNGFKFDGKTYDNEDVKYIVGDNLENVNSTVLEEMEENGNVKIYFSFDNKPLFIDGEADEIASNYVMLTADSKKFDNRGTEYYTFDVLNAKGEVVKYEVKDVDRAKVFDGNWNTFEQNGKNAVVKLTTDSNNKITKIEKADQEVAISSDVTGDVKEVEIDDVYLDGARLQANTTVFMRDGETSVKDYSVLRWADAKKEFQKVLKGTAYVYEGKVVAIDAVQTDGDEQTDTVIGILKKAKEVASKTRYDLVVEVNGKEVSYFAKDFTNASDMLTIPENTVVELEVTKDGKEVKKIERALSETVSVKRATASRIVDVNEKEYFVEGKYYNNDLKTTINAADVEGKTVTVYFQPGTVKKYIQVVQAGAGATPPTSDSGKVTYINSPTGAQTYQMDIGTSTVEVAAGSPLETFLNGDSKANATNLVGSKVSVTTNNAGKAIGLKAVELEKESYNNAFTTALLGFEGITVAGQGNTAAGTVLNVTSPLTIGVKDVTITNTRIVGNLTVDAANFTSKSNHITGSVIVTANGTNASFNTEIGGDLTIHATGVKVANVKVAGNLDVKATAEVAVSGTTEVTGTVVIAPGATVTTTSTVDKDIKDEVIVAEASDAATKLSDANTKVNALFSDGASRTTVKSNVTANEIKTAKDAVALVKDAAEKTELEKAVKKAEDKLAANNTAADKEKAAVKAVKEAADADAFLTALKSADLGLTDVNNAFKAEYFDKQGTLTLADDKAAIQSKVVDAVNTAKKEAADLLKANNMITAAVNELKAINKSDLTADNFKTLLAGTEADKVTLTVTKVDPTATAAGVNVDGTVQTTTGTQSGDEVVEVTVTVSHTVDGQTGTEKTVVFNVTINNSNKITTVVLKPIV